MKRTVLLALCLVLTLALLSGCGAPAAPSGKLSIVTTIFPPYDWVRSIAGDADVELTMLLDNGVDLHSYQPTANDILKISTCDMFIYVGGMSDAWVDDALKDAANPNRVVINLLQTLGDAAKEEELVEGMEAEEEDEDETEYDEHVWLSVQNAALLCREIENGLCVIDPEHRDAYAANLDAYLAKLDALDAAYAETVESAAFDTLLFGDRFPFRYLTDDYGLNYYAAFLGCSAETEASFDTVIFLANKADELGLRAIMQIESSDGSLARTIRDTTQAKDQQILTLNSLQSVTAKELRAGVSYLSVMEENLAVLQSALN